MAVTIDGANLLITLESGVTQVNVADIYSDWKRWMVQGDNAKYLPAFRTVGGDPLTSIINAGAYYFLRNDYGWRIKPPEEDITIYTAGNLAAQDTSLPVFLATDGAFTAAILGLQPVTQGVTPVMASQLAFGSFAGGVWVDQSSSLSGTGLTETGEPIGNAANPVNNFADARVIQQAFGLPETFFIRGNATLDTGDDVSGFKLVGSNAIRTVLTVNEAAVTNGCTIDDCYLVGNLDGGTLVERCVIDNVNYINGFVHNCMLANGTVYLGGANVANFLSCYSGVPGTGTPILDCNGFNNDQATPLAIRDYKGGIQLTGLDGGAAVSIDLASGQVKIDLNTCTNGNVVVRGSGKVIDTNGNHLMSGTYNGNLTILNEANFGDHVHDLWQLAGLDVNNPLSVTQTSRAVGGISQTISGDGRTTSTVTRNP